jgi:hypothetical protein
MDSGPFDWSNFYPFKKRKEILPKEICVGKPR